MSVRYVAHRCRPHLKGANPRHQGGGLPGAFRGECSSCSEPVWVTHSAAGLVVICWTCVDELELVAA